MSAAERLVSAEEMAEILVIDKRRVYKMAKAREIPHMKIGGTYRFAPKEVIERLTILPEDPKTEVVNAKPRKRRRRKGVDWSGHS